MGFKPAGDQARNLACGIRRDRASSGGSGQSSQRGGRIGGRRQGGQLKPLDRRMAGSGQGMAQKRGTGLGVAFPSSRDHALDHAGQRVLKLFLGSGRAVPRAGQTAPGTFQKSASRVALHR